MLSLSDWKVLTLGQKQIILKHYKYKNIKGDLQDAYLVEYKGFRLLWSNLHSNFCYVLFFFQKIKASIYLNSLKVSSSWI